MAFGKWIGGFLGFMSGGPLGALAGIVLGGLFDSMLDAVNTPETQGTFESPFGQQQAQQRAYQGQRNSFLFSMLVLASYIIKADGKVMHSEMEVVRNVLRQNFGNVAQQQGEEILRRLFDEQKRVGNYQFRQTVMQCCQQIAMNMDHAQRLQLLNFLVIISQADGRVDATEVTAMKECAQWMQMSVDEVDSMLGLGKVFPDQGPHFVDSEGTNNRERVVTRVGYTLAVEFHNAPAVKLVNVLGTDVAIHGITLVDGAAD